MSEPLLFCWIAAAALLYPPGQRRALAWSVWLYPIVGLLGLVFVWTVEDWEIAVALRVQWVALSVSALAVARLAVDRSRAEALLRDIVFGCSVAQFLVLSALVVDPGAAFRAGLGRFFPFGANPNHVGLLFVVTVPLALWLAQGQRWPQRAWLIGSASLGVGLALLTASRSVLLTMTALLLPLAAYYRKKPLVLIACAIVALTGASALYMAASDEASSAHLENMDTDRVEVAEFYLTHAIAERPIAGLLGTRGQSVFQDTSYGTHPHNAYLELLYVGGIVYTLPMLAVLGAALGRAWTAARVRVSVAQSPLLANMVLMLLVVIAAQGFVNGAMFYPTYPWAFLHVLAVGICGSVT